MLLQRNYAYVLNFKNAATANSRNRILSIRRISEKVFDSLGLRFGIRHIHNDDFVTLYSAAVLMYL